MTTIVFLSLLTTQMFNADLQIQGSWMNKTDIGDTHVLLFSGSFYSHTIYKTNGGAFVMTKGGKWTSTGNKIKLELEFHTEDSSQVGLFESLSAKLNRKGLKLKGPNLPKGSWEQLDTGINTDLTNPWLFSGRKRNGELSRRDTNRPRKTMKILTGTRFQWIAYNTATKQFFGTGGGTYTAEHGKYTENIEFFSRDNNRVGASLQFNYEMIDGEWHHSGKSSKGDPMYEIWAKRQK